MISSADGNCVLIDTMLKYRHQHGDVYSAANSAGTPYPDKVCIYCMYTLHHICVSKLYIIGSDNGLSPGRRQVIIWTNAGILLIGHLGTNFNETSMKFHAFSLKKIHLKMEMAAILSGPQCVNHILVSDIIRVASAKYKWHDNWWISDGWHRI